MMIMGDPYKLRHPYDEMSNRSRSYYEPGGVRTDPISSLYAGRMNVDTSYDEVRAKAKERFPYK